MSTETKDAVIEGVNGFDFSDPISKEFEKWYFGIYNGNGKPPLAMQIRYWFEKYITPPSPSLNEGRVEELINSKYDDFFGTGYWEKQYKQQISIFAKQCVEQFSAAIKDNAGSDKWRQGFVCAVAICMNDAGGKSGNIHFDDVLACGIGKPTMKKLVDSGVDKHDIETLVKFKAISK